MKLIKSLLLVALSAQISFAQQTQPQKIDSRNRIELKGTWQFALDPENAGTSQQWFLKDLNDQITLPSTTDEARKGYLNKDTTTMHLNRIYQYEGAAWYRKKVFIPKEFAGKHIALVLERSKNTRVWVDGQYIGSSSLLQSAQKFELGKSLSPGNHSITICVNNSLKLTPYGNVHIYSDDTETNWNGIIGKIYLEASARTYISDLQVYPDIATKSFDVKLALENGLQLKKVKVELRVQKVSGAKTEYLKIINREVECLDTLKLNYALGGDVDLWDEYRQPLYKVTATITSGTISDAQTVSFGMRKFSVSGTQFAINGRTTFLRGKHEACVFPLSGHPPMDEDGWLRVFKIAKSYGINHYRFHSYCPPEAAFVAADKVGIYLQPELPFWGELSTDSVASMLLQEGFGMLKSYANHPSFVMFSHGNELGGKLDRIEKNIVALSAFDSRPLYTEGSNIYIGYHWPEATSQFYVGARIASKGDTTLTHTRLTHAFADSREGGILNTWTPSTTVKFDYPVSQFKIPIVSHEVGQYQIYPDYSEIKKYTGVLAPRNLEVFRKRLEKAGMLDQDRDFQKASGAWSALCYKAEMEAAIRTKGFGGFQLLDLQDFPGQGTALVGILDAFMDSKNVVNKQEWLNSCNDVVLLAEFPKYTYTNLESFQANVEVANYSNKPLKNTFRWIIRNSAGMVLEQGEFKSTVSAGGVSSVGQINYSLKNIIKAEKLSLEIAALNTSYQNSYPIWVYPQAAPISGTGNIITSTKLDEQVLSRLEKGGNVLLFPSAEDVKDKSVGGLFPPEFWNWGMFKGISEWAKKPISPGTLGILTNPSHAVFNSFPTDSHTNWQWFSIIKASRPLILDETDKSYRPVIQVIDNLERNHKLGLLFEFKVGEGKLVVCMAQLPQEQQKPEVAAFYQSIINYMNSANFNPSAQISRSKLLSLLSR